MAAMLEPADALKFDPTAGRVIRTPPGRGYGYWVGGHKVSYDPESGLFALFYRERAPLEFGRGGSCVVALSTDGVDFSTVWTADKSELASGSIEVGHVVRHDDSEWRLYVSYERAKTSVWRIDVITADHPANFVAQSRRTVLEPGDFGIAWIKDPWILRDEDGAYDLYAAVPARSAPRVEGAVVTAGSIDATVLAHSDDGFYFPTIEYVFEAAGDDSWHGRRGRLDSLFPFGDGLVGTYSGGRTMYDNYEEWCGLVQSPDGRSISRIPTPGPWVVSPHGCVRYVWGLVVEGRTFFYYEYTTEDGSHDLRVVIID